MSFAETQSVKREVPALGNSPIIEAVLDIRSNTGKNLELDPLVKDLSEKLPGYKFLDSAFEFTGKFTLSSIRDESGDAPRVEWKGVRMHSSDSKNIIRVTKDGLLHSRLQPYCGWNQFLAESKLIIEAYKSAVGENGISRIGVRTINKLTDVSEGFDLGFWFRNASGQLNTGELSLVGFSYVDRMKVGDSGCELSVGRFIAQHQVDALQALFVDIDVFWSGDFAFDEGFWTRLETMRRVKNQVFFDLLSDSAIRKFL